MANLHWTRYRALVISGIRIVRDEGRGGAHLSGPRTGSGPSVWRVWSAASPLPREALAPWSLTRPATSTRAWHPATAQSRTALVGLDQRPTLPNSGRWGAGVLPDRV